MADERCSLDDPRSIHEPAREIPVTGLYDVLVVGGGMAGVAAAVAAAREGARVGLVERYCSLGGLATLGNVTIWLPLCDGRGRQVIAGLGEELLQLSVADLGGERPAARFRRPPTCWQAGGDPEQRKLHRYRAEFNPAGYMLALEALVGEAGVEVLYDTRFCVVRSERGRLTHVIVENKDGRSALGARTVIDATGDADVCFAAGEDTVSLDTNVLTGWFYTLAGDELTLHQHSHRYSPQAGREGAQGPFFRGDDARQVTDHILQTRQGIRARLQALRAQNPDADVQLLMPPTMACFRMTRRLTGRFTLGERHVHQWHDDAIGLTGDWRRAGPVYAIPFRCLRAVGHRNLLAAGRCISVDESAWDALRAIPPCVVTGQAAGVAAALAAERAGGDIDALQPALLQERLRAQGVLLDPHRVGRLEDGAPA